MPATFLPRLDGEPSRPWHLPPEWLKELHQQCKTDRAMISDVMCNRVTEFDHEKSMAQATAIFKYACELKSEKRTKAPFTS